MLPSWSSRFWRTETGNAINSPVKVTAQEERLASAWSPRVWNPLSPPKTFHGMREKAANRLSTQLRSFPCKSSWIKDGRGPQGFRRSGLCQEKRNLIRSKGICLSWPSLSHTLTKAECGDPFKSPCSDSLPDPNQMTHISWRYWLNEAERDTIFLVLPFPLSHAGIMTVPSPRITVKTDRTAVIYLCLSHSSSL